MIFKRRKKYFKKRELNNFELEKPNTKAKKTLLIVEIAIILVVIFGTGFSLVKLFDFSPVEFCQNNVNKVAPKSPVPAKVKVEDKADKIIKALPAELFTLKSVQKKTAGELRVVSKQGTLAVFSLEKSADFQLTTLQNLLTKAKINKKKVKKVDLRFEKVVTVYGK